MFILELHPNLTALVGAALHFTAEEKMCSLVQLDLLMRFSQWKRKTGKLEYWEIGTWSFPIFPMIFCWKSTTESLGHRKRESFEFFLGSRNGWYPWWMSPRFLGWSSFFLNCVKHSWVRFGLLGGETSQKGRVLVVKTSKTRLGFRGIGFRWWSQGFLMGSPIFRNHRRCSDGEKRWNLG